MLLTADVYCKKKKKIASYYIIWLTQIWEYVCNIYALSAVMFTLNFYGLDQMFHSSFFLSLH